MHRWLGTHLALDQPTGAHVRGVQGLLGESRVTESALNEPNWLGNIGHDMRSCVSCGKSFPCR